MGTPDETIRMADKDDATALLLKQLSSDAADLVNNDDLVAAARSSLQNESRAGPSYVSSREVLAELQREAIELASPVKGLTLPQLHCDHRESDYGMPTASTAALPSVADMQVMHREAKFACDAAEQQMVQEKLAALRATALATDLADSSEILRRRLAQASQAERWLSEQIKEKDVQLQRLRKEVEVIQAPFDVEQTAHEMSARGSGETVVAEQSLPELMALVEESIVLGADAVIEEEREAHRTAIRQEGVDRGKRVMAEKMTAACTCAHEDLRRRAVHLEALADQKLVQAEKLARAVEETTHEAQQVREEAQAAATSIVEQAAQMVGAPTRSLTSESTQHSISQSTRTAWLAAGACEISEDGLYEVALSHQAAATWAEEEIAPVLAKERSLVLSAQRDVAEATCAADLSVANGCAFVQELGATAIDLNRSVTDLVAQHWQLEASVSALKADQRMDAVLRSPAAIQHGSGRLRQERDEHQEENAHGAAFDAYSTDDVDSRIDDVLARFGGKKTPVARYMQQRADGVGIALHF